MGVVEATLRNIEIAARIVRSGGLVVYPTDTVYGLGCDPFNVDAVKKLIRVKGLRNKPLPVLSSSVESIQRVAEVSDIARRIGERFWPGPLTLVLPKRRLHDVVTFGSATVGVRIPNHEVALELIRLSGGLLVGTSANKTGLPPPTTAAEASGQMKDKVDVILDGGKTQLGVSSTVLDLSGEKPKIMRRGPLEDQLEALEMCLRGLD